MDEPPVLMALAEERSSAPKLALNDMRRRCIPPELGQVWEEVDVVHVPPEARVAGVVVQEAVHPRKVEALCSLVPTSMSSFVGVV